MDTLLDGLPLRRASSPQWAGIALENLDEVLIDHAYCEHKAATTALGMIGRFPDCPQLVRPMLALAREEMQHFQQVFDLIEERGLELGGPRPDRYVRRLRGRFCTEGQGLGGLGDLLLVNAFVEARSCERFRLLAIALSERKDGDTKLAHFYDRLATAEGRHWELFRDLAEEVMDVERVRTRLDVLADMEAEIIAELPVEPRMH